jgi:rhodanese-related sulfurtransferase
MKTTTRQDITYALDKNEKITLVEVNSQAEFDKGHLKGAVLIGKDEVKEKAPKLLADKAARIVVYGPGKGDKVSGEVCGELTSLGYSNVSDYREGKADWIAAGGPVVSTTAAAKG